MALRTQCPNCQANYTLSDNMRNKSVSCKHCEEEFVVEEVSPPKRKIAESMQAAKPTKASRPRDEDDELAAKPKQSRRDDESLRSKPQKKSAAKQANARDEESDDDFRDEETRPARGKSSKRKKPEKKSRLLPILLGVGAVLFLVCGGVAGVLAYMFVGTSTPVASSKPSSALGTSRPTETKRPETQAVTPPVATQPAPTTQPVKPPPTSKPVVEPPIVKPTPPVTPPVVEPAGGSIAPETVDRVKRASVFVKVEVGNSGGTGSGFLVQVQDKVGYVITNHHVIFPKNTSTGRPPFLPPPVFTGTGNVKISLVFNSGQKDEFTVPGKLVASDAPSDLAVLKIEDVAALPKPIDLQNLSPLRETLPIYVFGFPLGELLASDRKSNPAITISNGTITSLRNDTNTGRLKTVQLDASVNPGNSGGAVVDRQGRLVGVVKSKIRDEIATNISQAIPPNLVADLMQGRPHQMKFKGEFVENNTISEMKLDLTLFNPTKALNKLELHYVPSTVKFSKPSDALILEKLPEVKKVALNIEGENASGSVRFTTNPAGDTKIHYQLVWSHANSQGTTYQDLQTFTFTPANIGKGATVTTSAYGATTNPNQLTLSDEEVAKALETMKGNDAGPKLGVLLKLGRAEPTKPNPELALTLVDYLKNTKDFSWRLTAFKALGNWGTKEEVPFLLEELKDSNPVIRSVVMEALGKRKDERACEPIAARLPELTDRTPAAQALTQIGPIAEPSVCKLLKHNELSVKLIACDILRTIGTKECLALLEPMTKDDNRQIASAARITMTIVKARHP